jgi:hypothetical protein
VGVGVGKNRDVVRRAGSGLDDPWPVCCSKEEVGLWVRWELLV